MLSVGTKKGGKMKHEDVLFVIKKYPKLYSRALELIHKWDLSLGSNFLDSFAFICFEVNPFHFGGVSKLICLTISKNPKKKIADDNDRFDSCCFLHFVEDVSRRKEIDEVIKLVDEKGAVGEDEQ